MAAEKWMVQTKRADFNSIANKYGISPVTARIMRNRDVVGDQDIEQYLFGSLKDLYDPGLLKDMDCLLYTSCSQCGIAPIFCIHG